MAKKDVPAKMGLDDYGIIFISGDIEEGQAQSVCEKIIEINVTRDCDLIQLIINSDGGFCSAAFSIIDMM
ncbi:MAG: ATP-dependent Clp protease proteolytic subunit, partial [Candidatus Hodarchaeota archaeon]